MSTTPPTSGLSVTMPDGYEGQLKPRHRSKEEFSFHHKGAIYRNHRRAFDALSDAIDLGHAPTIYPVDFILLILKNNEIEESDFNEKLDYNQNYLRQIARHGCNLGTYALPEPIKRKMAAISNKPYEFWNHYWYEKKDLEGITLDMQKDIRDVLKEYENYGGKYTKRHKPNQEDELQR